VVILHSNTHRIERNITKGCPQGSCCRPGFWIVLYDLLNMKYSSHTKLIALRDDLTILTYGKTLSEVEAYANSDLAKIEKWAWENKLKFNRENEKTEADVAKRDKP